MSIISSETRGSERVAMMGAIDSKHHQLSMASPSKSVSSESGGSSGAVSCERKEFDDLPAVWWTEQSYFQCPRVCRQDKALGWLQIREGLCPVSFVSLEA